MSNSVKRTLKTKSGFNVEADAIYEKFVVGYEKDEEPLDFKLLWDLFEFYARRRKCDIDIPKEIFKRNLKKKFGIKKQNAGDLVFCKKRI